MIYLELVVVVIIMYRFFSKNKDVMDLWQEILPLQSKPSADDIILSREKNFSKTNNADPETQDDVFLIRNRISRIYYRNRRKLRKS